MSKDKTRVVIGGSHGKTSITAMILHVLQKCNKNVDFMVGAQVDGFETMVHLTENNDFIVLEGDEYLSSPIDRRPKFHLYQANIALISGISWDHINVFPTKENYITFNLEKDSIFRELRLLSFRNKLSDFETRDQKDFSFYKNTIENINKSTEINLIIFDFSEIKSISKEFERYLLNLNKKILIVTELDFKLSSTKFAFF